MPSPQLSQAGDLIMEVYIEQQLPDNCVTLKVSPEGTGGEMKGWGGRVSGLISMGPLLLP